MLVLSFDPQNNPENRQAGYYWLYFWRETEVQKGSLPEVTELGWGPRFLGWTLTSVHPGSHLPTPVCNKLSEQKRTACPTLTALCLGTVAMER